MSSAPAAPPSGETSTRGRILAALAEIITGEGVQDVSVQDVADRAGVSHRTVYRHFPTKEALLDGLMRWVEDRMAAAGGMVLPDELATLPDVVRRNYALFDRDEEVVSALVRLQVGGGIGSSARARRTEAFVDLLGDDAPSAAARAAVLLLRQFASSRTWYGLRNDAGLSGEEAGAVAAWAVELVTDAITRGQLPTLPRSANAAGSREAAIDLPETDDSPKD